MNTLIISNILLWLAVAYMMRRESKQDAINSINLSQFTLVQESFQTTHKWIKEIVAHDRKIHESLIKMMQDIRR